MVEQAFSPSGDKLYVGKALLPPKIVRGMLEGTRMPRE